MAAVNSSPSSHIVKEGYLGTGMERKSSFLTFKSKHKQREWSVLKQEQGTVLDCYKDDTKTKLKERIQITESEVEIDKHEHDTYISIKRGKQVTFLRAENRQQRDDWYAALTRSLGLHGAAESTNGGGGLMRERSGTDTSSNRPPVRTRGRNREEPQTTDGVFPAFKKALNDIAERPLPPTPPDAVEDDDTSKIRPPYCCMRMHVQASNDNGTNMAQGEVVYENVHFVTSYDEWIAEVETRRRNLGYSSEMYNDLNAVLYMQRSNEPSYETRVFRRREPEQNDERDSLHGINDLDSGDASHRVSYPPNVTEEDDESRRGSVESNEDNTHVPPARPTPPPIPTPTGEALHRKIEKTREDQRQPHGISKTFPKSCVVGDKIQFMEEKDGIWVIHWDKREKHLRGALKVGDQVIKVNKQALISASYAQHTINSTDDNEVTLVVKRIPHGTVCVIRRNSGRDDLGICLERNEIIRVDPQGLAARRGNLKPQTTGVSGRMCNWAITEINTQPVDLFASADDIMKRLRQAGTDVALIVQPVDFIQMMRDNLPFGSASK